MYIMNVQLGSRSKITAYKVSAVKRHKSGTDRMTDFKVGMAS